MKKQSNINRRNFVKSILFGTIGGNALANLPWLTAFTNTIESIKENEVKSIPPNIILIVVDDQIISSLQVMPTIQSQLVDRGITFSNSFCASPVCAPARASILTGQYLPQIRQESSWINGIKKTP